MGTYIIFAQSRWPESSITLARPILRRVVYQCCLGRPNQRLLRVIRWIDTTLQQSGFATGIFANAGMIEGEIRSIADLPHHDDYVLVLHNPTAGTRQEVDAVLASRAPIVVMHHANLAPVPPFALSRWRARGAASIAADSWALLELHAAGYSDAMPLPWLPHPSARGRQARDGQIFTIVAPGDMMADSDTASIVDLFAQFRAMREAPCRLVLLGRTMDAEVASRVQQRIQHHGLGDIVVLTGTTDAEARSRYLADADICLVLKDSSSSQDVWSEAVESGLPVLAEPSSAMAFALGASGTPDKQDGVTTQTDLILAVISDLADHPERRQALAATQFEHVRTSRPATPEMVLMAALGRGGAVLTSGPVARRVFLQQAACAVNGDFAGHTPQSQLNSYLATALEQRHPGSVRIVQHGAPSHSDDAPLHDNALVKMLSERKQAVGAPTVVIHEPATLPARKAPGSIVLVAVADSDAPITLDMVIALSRKASGVLALSTASAKALNALGLRVPVTVIGPAIDVAMVLPLGHRRLAPPPATGAVQRDFVVLHDASCSTRSGVDLLLAAWTRAFTAVDPVKLILLYPGEAEGGLQDMIADAHPGVELARKDPSLWPPLGLLERASYAVLPTRDEDASRAAAEAMAAGVPVIITGHGQHRDLMDNDTGRLLEYRYVTPHADDPDTVAIEPDLDDLVAALLDAFDDHQTGGCRGHRLATAALQVASTRLDQRARADGIVEAASPLFFDPPPRLRRMAWMSPWGVRCGIAEYARALIEPSMVSGNRDPGLEIMLLCDRRTDFTTAASAFPGVDVRPVWDCGSATIARDVEAQLRHFEPQIMVIQHQDSVIGWDSLVDLVQLTRKLHIRLIVMLHGTTRVTSIEQTLQSRVLFSLTSIERVVVHGARDMENLRAAGVIENVVLLPHGAYPLAVVAPASVHPGQSQSGPCIGSYGFFLPLKGLTVLIAAFALLHEHWPTATLKLVNARYSGAGSAEEIQRCRALARQHGVDSAIEWHTHYLSDPASLALLGTCDLIVLPYGESSESASGAVRLALASGVPVATSNSSIFKDVAHVVHRVDVANAEQLAASLTPLLADDALRISILDRARAWLKAHDWTTLSHRLFGMADGLSRQPWSSDHIFPFRYRPGSVFLFSQIGKIENKSLVLPGTKAGYFFGPYLPLARGIYLACYEFDRRHILTGSARFEVYARSGTKKLATRAIVFTQDDVDDYIVDLPFTLTEALPDVELAAYCELGFQAKLLAVTIRRQASTAAKSLH